MIGYIKLHRQIVNWEWYTDINTKTLFLHCLLMSNHKDNTWRGIEIKLGTFASSLRKLSVETGLTVSQIRTSLSKLESTQDIAQETHTSYTVIKVLNYAKYQGRENVSFAQELHETSQSNSTPNSTPNSTQDSNKQEIKELKENKNDNNKDIKERSESIHDVYKVDTQVSIDKNKKEEKNIVVQNSKDDEIKKSVKYIIDYLNLKTDKSFSPKTKDTFKHIKARLDEGKRLEDFKYVIDVKCDEWLNTERDMYLRPSTLFTPSNFEKYLNQKQSNKKKANDELLKNYKETGEFF